MPLFALVTFLIVVGVTLACSLSIGLAVATGPLALHRIIVSDGSLKISSDMGWLHWCSDARVTARDLRVEAVGGSKGRYQVEWFVPAEGAAEWLPLVPFAVFTRTRAESICEKLQEALGGEGGS
jgi:hypothetical protein